MPADLVHRRAPGGILTESDPKEFEKVRTKQQNRPNSYLEQKRGGTGGPERGLPSMYYCASL